MPGLTAAELAAMRDTEETYFSSTCVIERWARTADGMGGYTEAWAAVGTVDCDIYPMAMSARDAVYGERLVSRSRWGVTLPHGTTITAQDRIVADNRTHIITFAPNNADHQTAVRVETYVENEEKRI